MPGGSTRPRGGLIRARRQVRAHLHAAEREQVVDQARHALGLLAHGLEEGVAGRGIVLGGAEQRLYRSLEVGKGRAQLVAGVGHEVGLHLDGHGHGADVAEDQEDSARLGAGGDGLVGDSLPAALEAQADGWTFEQLVNRILEEAVERYGLTESASQPA